MIERPDRFPYSVSTASIHIPNVLTQYNAIYLSVSAHINLDSDPGVRVASTGRL